jgi:hypothetical protein
MLSRRFLVKSKVSYLYQTLKSGITEIETDIEKKSLVFLAPESFDEVAKEKLAKWSESSGKDVAFVKKEKC